MLKNQEQIELLLSREQFPEITRTIMGKSTPNGLVLRSKPERSGEGTDVGEHETGVEEVEIPEPELRMVDTRGPEVMEEQ